MLLFQRHFDLHRWLEENQNAAHKFQAHFFVTGVQKDSESQLFTVVSEIFYKGLYSYNMRSSIACQEIRDSFLVVKSISNVASSEVEFQRIASDVDEQNLFILPKLKLAKWFPWEE